MVIDIVNYTAEQLAVLSRAKLQQICNAQEQKNRLTASLESALKKEKDWLVERGIFPSDIYERRTAAMRAACEAEIEAIRQSLLFYLRYADNPTAGSGGDGAADVPYEVDYSLSEEDRTSLVKTYYEQTYSDARERFNAFDADTFAKGYLGEMYSSLWHYFKEAISS